MTLEIKFGRIAAGAEQHFAIVRECRLEKNQRRVREHIALGLQRCQQRPERPESIQIDSSTAAINVNPIVRTRLSIAHRARRSRNSMNDTVSVSASSTIASAAP